MLLASTAAAALGLQHLAPQCPSRPCCRYPELGGGRQGRGAQSGITGKGGLVVSKRLSSLHPANGKCDVLVWLEVGSVEELSVESE